MLVKLGLLKVQPKLYEEIMRIRQNLFTPSDRVLGVNLRGTHYVAFRPYGHNIQPPIEYALSIVVQKFQEWNCNKIFLATEDIDYVKIFKQLFGSICVTIEREYLKFDPRDELTAIHTDRKNDYYLRGKEYLTELVIASMCNSLVTCRTSGAAGIMLMSNGFENFFDFNLGRYDVIGLD